MARRRRKNPLTSDQFLMIGVGAVIGAVGYSWYKSQQALAAAAASPLATSTPSTTLPAPVTGAQSGYTGGQGG